MESSIFIVPFGDHSITTTEIGLKNFNFWVPVQSPDHHSSIGLVLGDTLEPDPILVNQVDAGFFCWTRLRWIRTLFPRISWKIPKGRMSIVKVDTSTLEQLALIQVFARIIWGKVKARRYSLIKSYMDLPQIPLDRHNGGRHQCWCNPCSRRTSSPPPCTRQGHGSLGEALLHLKE